MTSMQTDAAARQASVRRGPRGAIRDFQSREEGPRRPVRSNAPPHSDPGVPHGAQRTKDDVSVEFRRCDPALPPASELIDAVLDEYDAIAGRALSGGPCATAAAFSPPGGAFLAGFIGQTAVCGGGIKALGGGAAEIKRMYVVPRYRRRGVGRALLHALEAAARDRGHQVMRLDSAAATWPLYLSAGDREVANYNDNPHAAFWGEKRL